MGYEPIPAAESEVRSAFAYAMADLGEETVGIVHSLAPHVTDKYRRTIGTSTYLDGKVISGKALKNIGVVGKGDIQTVVYSSSPLSWVLEFGTAKHWIGIHNPGGMISDPVYGFYATLPFEHPGSRRFPHFGPAAIAALHSITRIILAGYARRVR